MPEDYGQDLGLADGVELEKGGINHADSIPWTLS